MSTHLCSASSFDTTSSEAARERIAPHRALWSSPFEEANAREFATDPSGLESSALSRAFSTASIVVVLCRSVSCCERRPPAFPLCLFSLLCLPLVMIFSPKVIDRSKSPEQHERVEEKEKEGSVVGKGRQP